MRQSSQRWTINIEEYIGRLEYVLSAYILDSSFLVAINSNCLTTSVRNYCSEKCEVCQMSKSGYKVWRKWGEHWTHNTHRLNVRLLIAREKIDDFFYRFISFIGFIVCTHLSFRYNWTPAASSIETERKTGEKEAIVKIVTLSRLAVLCGINREQRIRKI